MDFGKLKIAEYNHWDVYLHQNQFYLGWSYIWAKREDAVDFMELTNEERDELFMIGRSLKEILTQLFKPDLMNYASLGNRARHLHLHVIPRYSSARTFDGKKFFDERWGKNYSPYKYDFELPESTLFKLRDLIKEKL